MAPDSRVAFVPEGPQDRSLARSAWDITIPRNRPVGYGLILAGVRTSIRRLKYWSDEASDVRREEIQVFRETVHQHRTGARTSSGISCQAAIVVVRRSAFRRGLTSGI